MIYAHGSYQHQVHVLDWSKDPEFNSSGLLVRSTTRAIIEGKVSGADQGALKTAILALETAYLSTVVTKSGLLHNDGSTDSAHIINLSGATSENGITCRLRWTSEPQRAEYTTYRSFQIAVQAIFLGPGADEFEYSNRIVRIGDGGPIRVPRLTLGGVIIQQAYPASPFVGLETGRKVSRAGIVAAKVPAYLLILQHDSKQVDSGTEKGPDGITRYFATWTYNYLSATAF